MKANEERINANRSHYTEIARVSYGFPKHSRHLTRQRWKSRWDKTVAEYLLAIQPQLFAQQNVISPLKRSLQPGERGFPLVSRGMLLKQARRWKKFGNISFVCRRFDDYKNLLENLRSSSWSCDSNSTPGYLRTQTKVVARYLPARVNTRVRKDC